MATTTDKRVGRAALLLAVSSFATPIMWSAPAAAQTTAGTAIVNVAQLRFGSGNDAATIDSNPVSLSVARVIDVTVAAVVARRPVGAGPRDPIRYIVRNVGNAAERFTLSAAAVPSPATVAGIVTGSSDASPSAPGEPVTIDLQPGEQREVTVFVDAAAAAAASGDVTVALTATAVAGYGAPGTVVDAGPPEALVGRTGASASARTILTAATSGGAGPAPGTIGPSLAKSQSVRAPDGSARVMTGSIVTYRLDARFPTVTADVALDDPIPAGTTYVPGSLSLDGVALSDAADRDAGGFDGGAIHVALGDVAASATRTVTFQAVIQ